MKGEPHSATPAETGQQSALCAPAHAASARFPRPAPDPDSLAGGRLHGIDALRGIAALGVVLFHAAGEAPSRPESLAAAVALPFRSVFSFGYVGVFLFFVISGFCIHLQWARWHASGQSTEIEFKSF